MGGSLLRRVLAGFFVCFGCGDDAAPPPGDAGGRDGGSSCSGDPACDDGLFCNGVETCAGGMCAAGAPPCSGTCDEAADTCGEECADDDGDGATAMSCGGTDCDDTNAARFPGNAELCDAANLDEDCDVLTFGFRDADGDASPDERCCNETNCGDDCDDMRPSAHGTATEVCDRVDNDCDDAVDEMVLLEWFPDLDGDGYGDETATAVEACAPPPMHVLDATDCDDGERTVHPGAFDVCDGVVDQDCNGTPDDPAGGCSCVTGTMRLCELQLGRCMGSMQACVAGTWSPCTIVPTAETCDDSDEDCDGSADEMLPTLPYHPDVDSDGFGDTAITVDACRPVPGHVLDARDCYDANAEVRPDQRMFFGIGYGPDERNFDYDCDGVERYELPARVGRCTRRGDSCITVVGWVADVPVCGRAGTWIMECTPHMALLCRYPMTPTAALCN